MTLAFGPSAGGERPCDVPEVRDALRAEIKPLLVERMLAILSLCIVMTAVTMVTQLALGTGAYLLLYRVQAAALVGYALLILGLLGLRHAGWWPAVTTSLAAVGWMALVIAGVGCVNGDHRQAAYMLTVLTVGGAMIFPWGVGPQTVFVMVAVIGFAVSVQLGVGLRGMPPNIWTAIVTAFGASVWGAATLERQRRERKLIELLQERQRALLERIASDTPLDEVLGQLVEDVDRQTSRGASAVLLARDDESVVGRVVARALSPELERHLPGVFLPSGRGQFRTMVVLDAAPGRGAGAAGEAWDAFRAAALAEGYRTVVCAPIADARDHVLGSVVRVRRDTGGAFAGEQTSLADAARVARIAIERDRSRRDIAQYVVSMDEARRDAEAQAVELAHARDAAVASAEAKSEFLATMSHEIRTPMNGIFGMTELAMDATDEGERRDFLLRARACADTLMALLNDILDFSKIEAGKLELEETSFSPRAVVEQVLDTLAVDADRKGLELVGFVDDVVPASVCGDPGRFRQVLMNLANNALKFTAHGEVVLHVKGLVEAGDLVLHTSVRDTGIGIPPSKQRAIFEAFTQADSSTTRAYGGTGLGLAISQRLVTLMGGTIGVESADGSGSTFWFTVPVRPAPVTLDVVADRSLEGLRVLIVDDNETNRWILMKMLEIRRCRPVLASNGREACDLFQHWDRMGEPFDLILLDMHMPELDGAATAARIRDTEAGRAVTIILLTSVGFGRRALPSELRLAAVLPKPVKQMAMLEAVAAATGRSLDPTERPGPETLPLLA